MVAHLPREQLHILLLATDPHGDGDTYVSSEQFSFWYLINGSNFTFRYFFIDTMRAKDI